MNFGAGKAKVSFNPASVNLEKIKKGIESLGYKVKEKDKKRRRRSEQPP